MGLAASVVVFLVMASVVVAAGARLAAAGDEIAERSGWGRLFVGTLLLAFATSMPEVVADVTAAAAGAPDLAVADLFGSSMANMAILALIDLRHRGRVWPVVELGHARVAAVAIALTALAALGIHTPPGLRIGRMGVTTILIFVLYVAAVAWFRRSPVRRETGEPVGTPLQQPIGWSPDGEPAGMRPLLVRFGLASLLILIAAPIMTLAVERITHLTGASETFVGATLLAVTTSLPELVASLAAVRIGAYDLAVGNLFGSNAANMSVLLFADAAYSDGPILAAVAPSQVVAAVGAILMMALAVAAIVGGAETKIKRLEPDAVVVLLAYVGALVVVGLAA